MPKYNILIHGKNVLIEDPQGNLKLGGFYAVRTINADHQHLAEKEAIELVYQSDGFKKEVKNDRSDPPILEIDEAWEASEDDEDNATLCFYIETDDPEVKYYLKEEGLFPKSLNWIKERLSHLTRH